LLVNLAIKNDMKHLIASFETTNEDSYVNLLEMIKQKPIKRIKENPNEVFDTFDFIASHFYRLGVDRLWNIDQIINTTEFMVKRYGIKTLVIDPYNRLNNEYTDREDKYIGSILAKLCMLSKKLNILVIFVAHPKKPDGEKVPTMYSISGSGDWYNMADYGIIVHRERDENTKELKNEPTITIAKVKNFKLGKPSGGEITLRYNVEKRILED
jgi:twinkle protein